jgi:hypothetical protein
MTWVGGRRRKPDFPGFSPLLFYLPVFICPGYANHVFFSSFTTGTTSNNNTKDSSNSPNPNNASSPTGGPTLNTLLPNSSNGNALSMDSPTSPTSALSLMSPTDGGEGGVGVWNLDMGVEMLVPKKEEVDEATGSGTGSGTAGGSAAAGIVKANKGMILRKSVEYIRWVCRSSLLCLVHI